MLGIQHAVFPSLQFVHIRCIVDCLVDVRLSRIMFILKNTYWVLITLNCCMFIARAEVKSGECGHEYTVPEWLSPSLALPPGVIDLKLVEGDSVGIAVQVKQRKDNVTLSLFALPFLRSEICSPAKKVYRDLRKFRKNYTLIAGEAELKKIYFANIFTGCYYVELANSMNDKWISAGVFFNTTYHYYDTTLNCESHFEPAHSDVSRQLRYELSLGLTCLGLRCTLYELSSIDSNNILDDLDNDRVPPSQECTVTYVQNGTSIKCLNRLDQGLTLVSESVKADRQEGWATVVVWKNLKKTGAFYYSKLQRDNQACNINDSDLMTWDSAVQIDGIIHGFQEQTSTPLPININNDLYTCIVGIATGMIAVAILVYWAVKYAKIMVQRKRVLVDFNEKPQIEDAELTRLNIGVDSDEILLVYARGSPQFMDKMGEFRSHIQNTCDCTVRDVYSPDDFPELAKVGVSDWVKQRLSGGSKVVWIDTPHFRSLFNGEPRPNTNFRDNAIPYAVKLATDLFQDPVTQYCRHFVVRVESLPVEKEHADPLLVISPHKRYYIPQHLDKLCDHLTK